MSFELRIGSALALIVFATGCPGTLDDKEKFEEAEPQPLVDPCNGLITKSCALQTCHDAKSASVDLTLEGREERTVDKPGVTCSGKYIDTANPEASLMYTKCASQTPTCGSPMPLGKTPLTDDELSCLLGYIQSLGAGGGGSGSAASSTSAPSSTASGSASSGSAGGN